MYVPNSYDKKWHFCKFSWLKKYVDTEEIRREGWQGTGTCHLHPLRLCKYCIQWMHYENAKFSSYFLPCRFGVSNGFHHVVMLIHKMIMWTLISAFPSVYAETRWDFHFPHSTLSENLFCTFRGLTDLLSSGKQRRGSSLASHLITGCKVRSRWWSQPSTCS